MLSRTATHTGQEITVETASDSAFNANLKVTENEVQHKLRFRFLSVVALALFCDYLLLTLCVPVLPALFGDDYSAFEIGLIFASKPFFQFLANPYMGSIVDKKGPKFPLLFGVLILAVSTFLFAYGLSLDNNISAAYIIVISARSVQGIASASTMSSGMTLCALTHHESNRGTAMGIAMLGVAMGTLSGPPMGGIMGYFLPLWSPYIVVGAMLLLNCTVQLFVLHNSYSNIPVYIKEKSHEDKHTVALLDSEDGSQCKSDVNIVTLLRNRKILFIAIVAMFGNACIGMIEPLIPLYLDDEFQQNILQQGLIFCTATLSYLVFTPIAGIVSDNYPKWACLTLGLGSIGAGFCIMYFSIDIIRVCVSLFFIGSGMSFIDTPSLPLLSEIIEQDGMGHAAGQVYALSDMALCIGFTVGPILGPLLQSVCSSDSTTGFRTASLIMGILCFACLPFPCLILQNQYSCYYSSWCCCGLISANNRATTTNSNSGSSGEAYRKVEYVNTCDNDDYNSIRNNNNDCMHSTIVSPLVDSSSNNTSSKYNNSHHCNNNNIGSYSPPNDNSNDDNNSNTNLYNNFKVFSATAINNVVS